jgi:ATP-dependent helicase HrpA
MQAFPRHRNVTDPKYDAIHRAVLSGLLSNIGQKSDGHEYTGARGVKFNIFPGSSLFKKQPAWVMAGEIVETTRLYARTVARIQPEWIERIGEHLLKRTYFDPHWKQETAHVVAYEKVTLYGLMLVAQRPVHYGPIDPKISREIFITHALVEGEYAAEGQFFRHNQRLVDEIRTLEAKSRLRDVLVDSRARYDFYDARVPAGIYNGPLFEKWRRQAERHDPRILFMSRRDLMQHGAGSVTQELFPDHLMIDRLRLPLEYHLEPGHPADGVTATIPLPMLNQLPAERFDWLVPGLSREKMTALIKSLPKDLRVNFVPAPDFAQAAYETLKPGDGSLLDALAMFLGKQKGVSVPREAFDPSSLLDHLHMNFKIVDEAGKQLAMGRNLEELRRKLGVEVKSTFSGLRHPQFTREKITAWDFGDLPESVQVVRHGMKLTAYPSLVDENGVVALRLLDSAESAKAAHMAGLRRLLSMELKDEIRYLANNLPGIREMCLQYSTLGPVQQLKDDLVNKTINRAFLYDCNVRTAMEYELRKSAGRRHRLLEVGREVAGLAGQILAAYQQVALQVSRPVIPAFGPAIKDVKEQLGHLLSAGFVTSTPDEWLIHFPRFLKAIFVRLQKLGTTGHSRDAERMTQVSRFWQGWLERDKKNRQQTIRDANLDLFRWMIEELRVSLFAQELKTSMPVSVKRLEGQWEKVRK